ncbi:MAG: C39 family peptidase [Candidatus Latescibacterota bacterium]|jgi:hypothetical protein
MANKIVLSLWSTGLPEERLSRYLPPECGPGTVSPLAWCRGEDGLWLADLPLPRAGLAGLREVLACCVLQTSDEYGYRFVLRYRTSAGERSGEVALDPVGTMSAPPGSGAVTTAGETQPVRAIIDLFEIREPLAEAHLRLEVHAPAPALPPVLVSVSLRGQPVPEAADEGDAVPGVALAVPPASQMDLPEELAHRVCSPTCLAMVLAFHGRPHPVLEVVRQTRHEPSGLYGVWPANLYAASRLGLLGYLLHLPSWGAARWLLDRGLPLIASVRFAEGELSGAPIPRTDGHLVVVRGYRSDRVLVNDPAAADEASVPRDYDRREFLEVWLERAAVGYVLLPPG